MAVGVGKKMETKRGNLPPKAPRIAVRRAKVTEVYEREDLREYLREKKEPQRDLRSHLEGRKLESTIRSSSGVMRIYGKVAEVHTEGRRFNVEVKHGTDVNITRTRKPEIREDCRWRWNIPKSQGSDKTNRDPIPLTRTQLRRARRKFAEEMRQWEAFKQWENEKMELEARKPPRPRDPPKPLPPIRIIERKELCGRKRKMEKQVTGKVKEKMEEARKWRRKEGNEVLSRQGKSSNTKDLMKKGRWQLMVANKSMW